jgi:3-oxoacyl-[acyl-carrier protein] reductase
VKRLEGRVALVTGASRGIGFATARRFAMEGARVCMMDVDGDGVEDAAAKLGEEGLKVLAVRGDVTSVEDAEAAVEEAVVQFGRLDILVNNAGILRDSLLFRMSPEEWDEVMKVHLYGAFNCTRAAQGHMVEQRYGRILNLSSTSALGNRGQANYAAVKAGIQGFTRTLAIELGPFGVTANAVAPGFVETEMTRATADRLGMSFEAFREKVAGQIPVGRIGQPEDIASALLYFASEEAGFVNGQVLYVAGGPRG